MAWGDFGREPACAHLLALRAFLEAEGLSVHGEFTESPSGWVNVHCERCARTYEVTLSDPWEAE